MITVFLLHIKIPSLLAYPAKTLQNNVVTMPEFVSLVLLSLWIEANTNKLFFLTDIALSTAFLWQLHICFSDLTNQDLHPFVSLLAEIRHTRHSAFWLRNPTALLQSCPRTPLCGFPVDWLLYCTQRGSTWKEMALVQFLMPLLGECTSLWNVLSDVVLESGQTVASQPVMQAGPYGIEIYRSWQGYREAKGDVWLA